MKAASLDVLCRHGIPCRRYTMPADMLYLRTLGICFVGCRLYKFTDKLLQ